MGRMILAAPLVALLLSSSAVCDDFRRAVGQAVPATVAVRFETPKTTAIAPVTAPTPFPPSDRRHSLALADKLKSMSHTIDTVKLASGTVVSPDGLIVTTLHDSQEGKYSVELNDRRTVAARPLVDDYRLGLVLLKIDVEDLPHVALADSSVQPGQDVVAGTCVDLHRRTVTAGLVVATDQRVPYLGTELVQTNLPVAPMSGGGPLTDTAGKLVGILVAGNDRSNNPAPITYAVPAHRVRALLAERKDGGLVTIKPGFIGIGLADGDAGVVISNVLTGTPASEARLEEGAIVTAVDDRPVASAAELSGRIREHSAGDQVTLTLSKDGELRKVTLALGEPPVTAMPRRPKDLADVTQVAPGEYRVRISDRDRIVQAGAGEIRTEPANGKPYVPFIAPSTAIPPISPVVVQRSDLSAKLDRLEKTVELLTAQIEKLQNAINDLRPSERK